MSLGRGGELRVLPGPHLVKQGPIFGGILVVPDPGGAGPPLGFPRCQKCPYVRVGPAHICVGCAGTSLEPAGQAARRGRPAISGPGTLTAAFIAADLAAVCGLADAVLTLAAGKSMLRDMVGTGYPLHGAGGDFVNGLIDAAYQTLQTRAITAVVVAVILGVFAFAVRGGRTGVRIGLTIVLLAAAGTWLLNVRDGGVPGMFRGFDDAALALSLVGIVLAWLPPNQRFAHGAKAGRRG